MNLRTALTNRLCVLFIFTLSIQFFAPCGFAEERRPVAELMEMLASDDRDQRRDAAHALADYGDGAEKAIDGLIVALKDRDIQIWHDATQALAHMGPKAAPALDALVEGMESSDDQRRFRVAYAIGSIGTAALPTMRERLSEKSGNIREVAVQAIGLMGPDAVAATPELILRLADKAEHIRGLAVGSLAQIGPGTIQPLQEALGHDTPEIRAGAAKALAAIGDAAQEVIPQLITLSSTDKEAPVRAAAVASLGRIAPQRMEIIEPLIAALQDDSKQVKRAAVEAWIPVSPQIQSLATPRLSALLASGDATVQTGVLLILNRFGPRAASATSTLLAELEKTPDSPTLTTTLGQIGKPALEPTYAALREQRITPAQVARIVQGMPSTLKREIARRIDDKSSIVRELAATTVGELVPFPRDGVAILERGLTDESASVRRAAAESVKLVGHKARDLAGLLSKAIDDEPDDEVCSIMLRAFAATRPDDDMLFTSLAKRLDHKSLNVRLASLSEIANQERLPKSLQNPLSELLEQPEPQVRALAAESLSLIKSDRKKSAELLLLRLDDENAAVRHTSMRSLARLGDDAQLAMPKIQEHLDSDSSETLVAAIESLSQLGKRSNDAMPKFKQLSKNSSEQVRQATLAGVRKIADKPEEAVQILIAGLQDSEWTLRRTAAQELGELEERAAAAIPALLEMMKRDEESDVARRAIRDIGTASEEALPQLLVILQDEKSGRRPRYYSLYLLRKMGPAAKSALPVLKQLREKSDGSMGDQFDRTIDAIENEEEDD